MVIINNHKGHNVTEVYVTYKGKTSEDINPTIASMAMLTN